MIYYLSLLSLLLLYYRIIHLDIGQWGPRNSRSWVQPTIHFRVPRNHPFFCWDFPWKKTSISGYPHFWKPPLGDHNIRMKFTLHLKVWSNCRLVVSDCRKWRGVDLPEDAYWSSRHEATCWHLQLTNYDIYIYNILYIYIHIIVYIYI